MFPNDDICNVDAARGAANRLFRRYKNAENRDQPVLGKSEVNRLMKAAYDAINMRNRRLTQPTTPTKRTSSPSWIYLIPTRTDKSNSKICRPWLSNTSVESRP